MIRFLRERQTGLREEMDRPDCDPVRLRRSYERFPLVNFLVAAWGRNYKRRIRPLLAGLPSPSLLDIGCGGGDLARRLARRASTDGYRLNITAVDPDARAFAFASAATPVEGVHYRKAHTSVLLAEGHSYDVVMSNHVLHHLSPAELAAILDDSARLATRLVLHNDLRRSLLAYVLFLAGFWPLGIGSYIHTDGLASIRRSYTAAELRAIVPPGWQVEHNGPWHLLLLYRPDGSAHA